MKKQPCTAIVLAAGQGKRMESDIQKQYLELEGKPVLYYALKAFQDAQMIDNIILVVGEGQESYCRKEVVEKYHFEKISDIVIGGAQRYHSVFCGLQKISHEGYVFIHDGARPFVDQEILERAYQEVQIHRACVVGMPCKDTIKVSDSKGFAKETPDRETLWMIQTPQVFCVPLISKAYAQLMKKPQIKVTDDAMVLEQMSGYPIKLVIGSYENIKITTPEDLEIARIFCCKRK
ncbi:MAG: 2-C-methyl-D-erythritol 4-phosphate cytidylyltransferase [Lachnospiraceae bacterium]